MGIVAGIKPLPLRETLKQRHAVDFASQRCEIDFDAQNAFAFRENLGLGFDAFCNEDSDGGRESRIEIEPFLVSHELFNSSDFTHPFDLNYNGPALRVFAQQIYWANIGVVLALEEFVSLRVGRSRGLQVFLEALLLLRLFRDRGRRQIQNSYQKALRAIQ